MIRFKPAIGLIMFAGALLSACHKQADGDAPDVDLFGSKADKPETKFGKTFEKSFNADPQAEPLNVSAGDLPPVDRTAEPVEVN